MLVAEPGRFQVQPALQPQAGGLAGWCRRRRAAGASSACSAAFRARRRSRSVRPRGSLGRSPSIRARARPIRACRLARARSIASSAAQSSSASSSSRASAASAPISRATVSSMTYALGPRDPGHADQGFRGEPLHDKRDHDHGGGEHQDQVPLWQRRPVRHGQRDGQRRGQRDDPAGACRGHHGRQAATSDAGRRCAAGRRRTAGTPTRCASRSAFRPLPAPRPAMPHRGTSRGSGSAAACR